jgi:hypothetical protein
MKSPLSFLVIEHYAGAAGRIANDATAFLHRHLPWDFIFGAQWTDPLETPMDRDWARRGEDALRPYSAHAHLSRRSISNPKRSSKRLSVQIWVVYER